MVPRFSPPTTQNVDVSWRRSSVLAAPPTPRCCSTRRTWIRCHTGSRTCRDFARTSAANSITPAGGTYQVITPILMTMNVTWTFTVVFLCPCPLGYLAICQEYLQQIEELILIARAYFNLQFILKFKWHTWWWWWWWWIRIHSRSHFSLRLSLHMYKWQVLGLMWCVSSLVGEYLFIQVLPHVTSSPFVATLEFTSLLDRCRSLWL